MRAQRIMMIGIGHVGRSVLRAWSRVDEVAPVRLVAAIDSRGRFEDDRGLDPATVVDRKARSSYDAPVDGPPSERIAAIAPDILVELSVTNVETGLPAVPDIVAALGLGIHVVTSAKSHQRSRDDLERVQAAAARGGAIFMDHAAHLAGIPVTEAMAGIGMEVTRLAGVLNGTTNFMLKRMEEGATYEAALREAVDRGYAEKDWRYDVQGTDVGIKLVGLARRLMGRTLDLHEISFSGIEPGRLGIEGMDTGYVRDAIARGERVKLFGEVTATATGSGGGGGGGGSGLEASVRPRRFEAVDPFARTEGFTNSIQIQGRLNDTPMELFLRGPGAGADETASRVIGNLRELLRRLRGYRE